ncbi:hypothetical protein KH5_09280 [Urechidicola sp. KH5]
MTLFGENAPALAALLFLIITYAFSIGEKLLDWQGTLTFLKDHFKQHSVKKFILPLTIILIVLEIITLGFLVFGVVEMVLNNQFQFAKIGAELSAITILFMLIGQRIAKDYPGAMNLGVYMLLNIFLLYLVF